MSGRHRVSGTEHAVSKYLLSELRTKSFSIKQFCLAGDIWQYPETVLVVTTCIWWVKIWVAIDYPNIYRTKNDPAPNANNAEIEKSFPTDRLIRDKFLTSNCLALSKLSNFSKSQFLHL